MVYKDKFNLIGTELQQAIVKDALDKIMFPWERITHPTGGLFICGWASLNNTRALDGARLHAGDHPAKDTDTDPFEIEIEGKRYTLGVFYPSSGNIYLDSALVNHPTLAQTTVSAEVAHLVDFFLPLTEGMKKEISRLMHGGSDADHGHGWWEKSNYGTEYYDLLGESFMQAFTLAYSDMNFDAKSFTHQITKEQAPEIRRILGIERTDAVAPVVRYMHFKGSSVYHTLNHYNLTFNASRMSSDHPLIARLRPCKICKP